MKKITALLVLILLITTMLPAACFEDLEEESCREAVELLHDLNIMLGKSETEFDPDGNVTRAEMATIVVRLLGIDNPSGTAVFEDVPSSHFAYNFINAAYQLGIINGTTVKTFEPDVGISYTQAIKMIVCTLGYTVYAENSGGYPAGYLAQAAKLGILEGTENSQAISRGTLAIILANAVDTEILVRTSYGSNATFEKKKGATLLSEYLGIYKYEGFVSGSYICTAAGNVTLKKDQVAINSEYVCNTGTTNAADLVGHNVTFYAKADDGIDVPTILSITKDDREQRIALDSDDIVKAEASKIYYGKDEKTISVTSDTKFIYNGKPSDSFIIPKEGTVTIIADSSAARVVFIDEYTAFTVKYINMDENAVYFKNVPEGLSDKLVIDIEDSNIRTMFINSDGSEAELSECKEWDVFSVFESADKKIMRIIRTEMLVIGKVTEYSTDGAMIDGEVYKISTTLSANSSAKQPVLGIEGGFCLDHNNKIVCVDEGTFSSSRYGYLVSAAMTKGMNAQAQLKIFTDDEAMKVYDLAEKVTLIRGMQSAIKVSNRDILDPVYGLMKSTDKVKDQLLHYEENESGQIIKIETYAAYSEYTTNDFAKDREIRQNYFSLDAEVDARKGDSSIPYIGAKTKTFLSRYHLDDECIIFNVPLEPGGNDKDYSMILPSSLVHGTYYPYIQFYDIKKDNTISVIITRTEIVNVVKDDALGGLVTDIVKGINDDGDPVTKVKVISENGDEVTLYADDDLKVVLADQNNLPSAVILNPKTETQREGRTILHEIGVNDVNIGDVVAYTENKSRITAMAVRFRVKAPIEKEIVLSGGVNMPSSIKENYCHSSQIIRFGTVVSTSNKAMLFEAPIIAGDSASGAYERIEPFDGATVLEFNVKDNTCKKIAPEYISQGDKVLTYRITNTPMLIIRYRNI